MDKNYATNFTDGTNFLTTDHSPLITIFEGVGGDAGIDPIQLPLP